MSEIILCGLIFFVGFIIGIFATVILMYSSKKQSIMTPSNIKNKLTEKDISNMLLRGEL